MTIPHGLRKPSIGYIVNPTGKRAQYYMSIFKAHSKMRKDGESDESFKTRFTTERSRQYDVLQSKETTFTSADGCSKRASDFFNSGYQLRPSDGKRLKFFLKEHRRLFDKLDGMVKDIKEHDSMLFQPNGLTLKQGEEFAHDFNVEQIKSIEAKLLKVKQEVETLEENKTSFHTIYKGINKEHFSKRRRKKENRRKSNERKKKRYETNVRRVYGVCVKNPLGNDLAECLLYPPSLAIPEECINVEDVAELLTTRDAAYIAQLLQSNHFSNAAGSRLITNLKPEVRDDVYCILYPEEYALPLKNESDSDSSTGDEEELEDD